MEPLRELTKQEKIQFIDETIETLNIYLENETYSKEINIVSMFPFLCSWLCLFYNKITSTSLFFAQEIKEKAFPEMMTKLYKITSDWDGQTPVWPGRELKPRIKFLKELKNELQTDTK